ncbi:Autophagy-related protein 27 [Trametes pubescens]|uniref:Autophagy-related protein 27 n=1 Tax=Trametes pubescens TaxID=154538 RepID=A0A1M2VE01_TRAPU|nr:Autophagy-related protein 27 [Trametes pubescens]
MAFLRHPLSRLALLTLVSTLAAAQDDPKPFDCHLTIGDLDYDLTKAGGEHTATRDVKVPPTTIEDKVTFNLCADLERKSDVPPEDQCPEGSRACLVRTNRKDGQPDRVFSVIPVANSSADAVTVSALRSPKGLELTFAGSTYPSVHGDADPIPQFLHLKLLCSPDSEPSAVNFTSYDGKDLHLEWSTVGACGFGTPKDGEKKPDDKEDDGGGSGEHKEESVGSGLGYFFLILLLAFVAYFGLGAYYNYTTYGASGVDLIP